MNLPPEIITSDPKSDIPINNPTESKIVDRSKKNFYKWFTDQEIIDFESLKNKESVRIFLKEKMKRCFPFFVYMLGYRDVGCFHEKELELIGQVKKLRWKNPKSDGSYTVDSLGESRRLWLWSRGFFKTSLITVAHSIYLIVHNPSIRILIVSYTIDVAKKMLGEIKGHFLTNDEFRYFFKEHCPRASKDGKVELGTTEYFTVPSRKKNYKEPTLMVAGVGTNLTGLHFDYIKADDLVVKDSVTNDDQIRASKDYYSYLRPLFDNAMKPKEDIVGTIYHFNDLHNDLRNSPDFIKSIVPVHTDGVFHFPERINKDDLEKLLNDPTIGPGVVYPQYLLSPFDPSKTRFKQEWFKTYDSVPQDCAEYICVDPASTQKKKSDYTVIERWAVDYEGYHHLLEGYRDKLTSYQRIDLLFDVVKRCRNLVFVRYEVLGGRHGDLETIAAKQRDQQCFFEVRETKSSTHAKEDRITQRLEAPFHAGVILFPRSFMFKSLWDGKTYDFVQEYKREFLEFPFSAHDDMLDCHAQMFEEQIVKGRKPKFAVKKKVMTADDEDRYYDSIKKMQGSNPFLSKEQIYNRLRTERIKRILQKV